MRGGESMISRKTLKIQSTWKIGFPRKALLEILELATLVVTRTQASGIR